MGPTTQHLTKPSNQNHETASPPMVSESVVILLSPFQKNINFPNWSCPVWHCTKASGNGFLPSMTKFNRYICSHDLIPRKCPDKIMQNYIPQKGNSNDIFYYHVRCGNPKITRKSYF